MYANNNVINNTQLSVSSVSLGAIVPGMQFKISGTYITINSQISPGLFSISTPSGIIPSIYPQKISASMSFSNSITLNIKIPDGFYDATSSLITFSRTHVLRTICILLIQLAVDTIRTFWKYCKIVRIMVSKSTFIHSQRCCQPPLRTPLGHLGPY
jgi:hypothetical protein